MTTPTPRPPFRPKWLRSRDHNRRQVAKLYAGTVASSTHVKVTWQ
jgi:hypothetical protein